MNEISFCCDEFQKGLPTEGLPPYPKVNSTLLNGEKIFYLEPLKDESILENFSVYVNGCFYPSEKFKLENGRFSSKLNYLLKKGDCVNIRLGKI